MSYHQTDRGSQQYWYGIDLWMKRNVAQNVQDKFSVEKVNILPPRLQVDFNNGSLPFHRRTNGAQPSKTIVTNGCLTPKPSENH